MTIRLYLAHPIASREDIRNKEIAFEERTGIELANPFYDSEEAAIIKKLDSGKMTVQEYSAHLVEKGHGEEFVELDMRTIKECDGVVGVIYRGTPTVGTSMELFYAAIVVKKPVYIVTNFPEHIWLIYVAEKSGGFIVETWSQLEEKLRVVKDNVAHSR